MMATTEPVVIITKPELDAAIEAAAKRAVSEMLAKLPPMNPARPAQVNKTQAAEMLNCHVSTVTAYIKAGKLRLNEFGMISTADIDRALAKAA